MDTYQYTSTPSLTQAQLRFVLTDLVRHDLAGASFWLDCALDDPRHTRKWTSYVEVPHGYAGREGYTSDGGYDTDCESFEGSTYVEFQVALEGQCKASLAAVHKYGDRSELGILPLKTVARLVRSGRKHRARQMDMEERCVAHVCSRMVNNIDCRFVFNQVMGHLEDNCNRCHEPFLRPLPCGFSKCSHEFMWIVSAWIPVGRRLIA